MTNAKRFEDLEVWQLAREIGQIRHQISKSPLNHLNNFKPL